MAGRVGRIEMTRELASAYAKDAANDRMRAAGRSVWNRADYNISVRTFNKLWTVQDDLDAQRAANAAA